jgi:hypothetical protein
VNKTRKALEAARAEAVTLRLARYFVLRADWLQERFPRRSFAMWKDWWSSSIAAIKAHDWSLTPGRYVGVVPEVTCEIAGKGFQHARDGRPSKTKGPAYPLGTAIQSLTATLLGILACLTTLRTLSAPGLHICRSNLAQL